VRRRPWLRNEPDRYKVFVYPRELDGKLRENIEKLQKELHDLGGKPEAE